MLRQLLNVPLQTLADRTEGDCFGQFLFARQDVLVDDFGITGARPRVKKPFEMVNRRRMILLVFLVQQPRLEMRQRRTRVGFQSLFKTLQRSLIIQRRKPPFSVQKMGFFFLVHLAVTGGQATAQSQTQGQEERAACQPKQEDHSWTLLKALTTFNGLF